MKVFYVSNRSAEEEPTTRKNLEKFGFPIDTTMDTVLTSRERPDWTSAKGTRRAFVAKEYRVLLNLGDNFSDFTDEYRGNEAERLAVLEQHKDHWGREWIMLPNPTYGSLSRPVQPRLQEVGGRAAQGQARRAGALVGSLRPRPSGVGP